MISKRYSVANNKCMAGYDKAKDDAFIVDLDMNNLYGKAVMKKITGGWI